MVQRLLRGDTQTDEHTKKLNILLSYDTPELYTERFSICPKIISKFRTIVILKSLVKIMIKIKSVSMSTIFYQNKLHLYKCDGSWAFSIKRNMNFNIQPFSTLECFVFYKNGRLKVVHSTKTCHNKEFHGHALTDESFASVSKVWTSAILERWRYSCRIKKWPKLCVILISSTVKILT